MTTTAMAVKTVEKTTPQIILNWRQQKMHSSLDHAIYALARIAYAAKHRPDSYTTTLGLKRLLKTFSPAWSKPNPLSFIIGTMDYIRQCNSNRFSFLITDEEWADSHALCLELFIEMRRMGDSLLELAPERPAPRVKKPYVPNE